jgi:hypothetical protein
MFYGLAFLFLIEGEQNKISAPTIYGFFARWVPGGTFAVTFPSCEIFYFFRSV